MLLIGDKILVDSLSQKGPFWAFADLKGENKAFFAHPFHAMLCRCSSYPYETTITPALNGGRGEGGGVWIVLVSEIASFKDSITDMILPLVNLT